MSLQYMVSDVVCTKGHPSLMQPLSSNLHGILLLSVVFLALEEEEEAEDEDLRADDGFVAVFTITTSLLLDTGVSSVTCLRLVRRLLVFGVGCSKHSIGGPRPEASVGVLGSFLSLGMCTVFSPEVVPLVVTVYAVAFGVGRSLILAMSMFSKILNSSTLSTILSLLCLSKNLSSSALFWNCATGSAKNIK